MGFTVLCVCGPCVCGPCGPARVAVTPVHIATITLEAYARSLSAPRWSPPGRFIILSAITHSVFPLARGNARCLPLARGNPQCIRK